MTTDAGQFFAAKQRDAAIRKLAREQWERDGEIEFADNAKISEGEGNEINGAYVAAWVWVDFAGTELDTSDEDEDEADPDDDEGDPLLRALIQARTGKTDD